MRSDMRLLESLASGMISGGTLPLRGKSPDKKISAGLVFLKPGQVVFVTLSFIEAPP